MKKSPLTRVALAALLLTGLFFYWIPSLSRYDLTSNEMLIQALFDTSSLIALIFVAKIIRLQWLIFALLVIHFIISSYYTKAFGFWDAGMVESILSSSKSESLEFLNHIKWQDAVYSAILTSIFTACLWLICNNVPRSKKAAYLSLLPFIALTSYQLAFSYPHHSGWLKVQRSLSTCYLVNDAWLIHDTLNMLQLQSIPIKPAWKDVSRDKSLSDKDVYIVMIGESARRSEYRFYNPNAAVSPSLTLTKQLSYVADAISPSVNTPNSIPRILAKNTGIDVDDSLNVIDLANMAGFNTYWLSNQAKVGIYDTPITRIALRAKHKEFLNHGDYIKAPYDDILLPAFTKIIQSNEKNKMIFIHQMGSHFDFCKRNWQNLLTNQSSKTKEQNCYSQTVNNTLYLIEQFKNNLQQQGLSYRLVYFSDHGLVKDGGSYSHGSGKLYNAEAVEVPFYFIEDHDVVIKKINHRYFLRDFTNTFAYWAGIHAQQIEPKLSILSPEFDPALQDDFIITSDNKIRKVENQP